MTTPFISKAQIYRKGKVLSVVQAAYVADPDGGGTIRDSGNDTAVSVWGLVARFGRGQIDNVNVQADDVQVFLDGLTVGGSTWTCSRGDRITLNSREMRVLDPSPVTPDDGDPIVYAAHCGVRADL